MSWHPPPECVEMAREEAAGIVDETIREVAVDPPQEEGD